MPHRRKLVIGLGSGRCGTRSLAALLNSQNRARVSHELFGPSVAWEEGDPTVWNILRNLPSNSDLRLVGDVASYYLPYVESILSVYLSARFVCLQRDREETIASFVKKTPRKNHWMAHDGVRWRHSPWDQCFPKYRASTKEQAIGQYWDEYYRRAEELQSRYPASFRVFPIEALNALDGQRQILDFLSVPDEDRRFAVGIRLNAAKPRGIRGLLRRLRRLLPGPRPVCPEPQTAASPLAPPLLRAS